MKMWLFSARAATADQAKIEFTLDTVAQEVRRLESIVRQFLEFSRPPETKLAWIPVSDLVTQSVSLVEPLLREKSISFRQELSSDLPQLYVDREQMIQVIVNLLR